MSDIDVRKIVRKVAERGGTGAEAWKAAQDSIAKVISTEFDACPVSWCPHSMKVHTPEGRCRVVSCSGFYTPCVQREAENNRPPYRGIGQRGSEAGCYS